MACSENNDRVPAVSLESLDYLLNDRRSINLSELPSLMSDRKSTSFHDDYDDDDVGIKILNTFSLAKNVSDVKTANRQLQKIPHWTSDEKIANKVVKYDHIDDYTITSFKSEEVADAFDQCLKCDDNVVDMGSQFQLFRLISSYKAQTQEGLQPVLEPDLIVKHRKKGFRGLNGRMRKFDRIFAKSLLMKKLAYLSDDEDDFSNTTNETVEKVDSNSIFEASDLTENTLPVRIKEEIDDDNIWSKIERDTQQTEPVVGEDVDSIFHSKQLDELLQQESIRPRHGSLFKIDTLEPTNKIRFETPSTQSSYIKTLESALNRKNNADANDNIVTSSTPDKTVGGNNKVTKQSDRDLPDSGTDHEANIPDEQQLLDTSSIHSKILQRRSQNAGLCLTKTITKQLAQVAITALKSIDDRTKSSLKKRPLVYNSESICNVPESHIVSVAPVPTRKRSIVSETPIPCKINKISSQPKYSLSNMRKTLMKHGVNRSFFKTAIEKDIRNLRPQKISSLKSPPAAVENSYHKPRTFAYYSQDILRKKMEDSAKKFLKCSKELRVSEVSSNGMESDQSESCSRVVPYCRHSARRSCGKSVQHGQESNVEQETKSTISSPPIENLNIQTKSKESPKKRTIDSILQYINNSNSSSTALNTDPVVNGDIWTMYAIVNLPTAEMVKGANTNAQKAGSWMGSTRVFKIISHCEDWIKSKVAILRVILSMDLNIEKRMLWYASAEIGEYFIEILLRAKGHRECFRLLPHSVVEAVDATKNGHKSTLSMVQIYKRNVRKMVIKKEDEQLNKRSWRQMLEIDRLLLIHFTKTNHWQKEFPEILGFKEADKNEESVKKYHLQMYSSGRQIKVSMAAEGVSALCKNILALSKSSSFEKASEVKELFQEDLAKVKGKSSGEFHRKTYSCTTVPSNCLLSTLKQGKTVPTVGMTTNAPKKIFVRNIPCNRDNTGLPCVVGYSNSKQQQISPPAKAAPDGNGSGVVFSRNVPVSSASLTEQLQSKCGSILPLPAMSSPRIYQYEPVTASNKSSIINANKTSASSQNPAHSGALPTRPLILGKRSGLRFQEKLVAKRIKKVSTTSAMSRMFTAVFCTRASVASAKVTATTGSCRVSHVTGLTKLTPKQVVLSSLPHQAKICKLPSSTAAPGIPAVVIKNTKVACTLTSSAVTSANSSLLSLKNKLTLLNIPVVNPTPTQAPAFSKSNTSSRSPTTYTLESNGLKYSLVPVTSMGGISPANVIVDASFKKRLVVQPALVNNAQGAYSFSFIKLSTASTITSATLNTRKPSTTVQCGPGYGKPINVRNTSISESQSVANMAQAFEQTSRSDGISTVKHSLFVSPDLHPLHVRNLSSISRVLPQEDSADSMAQGSVSSRLSEGISSKKLPIVCKAPTVVTTSNDLTPKLNSVSTSFVTGRANAPSDHINGNPVTIYSQKAFRADVMASAEESPAGTEIRSATFSPERPVSAGLLSSKLVPSEKSISVLPFELLNKASVGFMNEERTLKVKDKCVNEVVDSINHLDKRLTLDPAGSKDSDRPNARDICPLSRTIVSQSSEDSNLCDTEKCRLKQIQDIGMSSTTETTKRKQNVCLRTYSVQSPPEGNAEMGSSEKLKEPKKNCKSMLDARSLGNMSAVVSSAMKRTTKKLSGSIAIEFLAATTASKESNDGSAGKTERNSTLSVTKDDILPTDGNASSNLSCSTVVDDDLLSYDPDRCATSVSSDCTSKNSASKPLGSSAIALLQHRKGNVHRLALRKFSNYSKKDAIKQALKSLTQAEISKFNVECLANMKKTTSRKPIMKSKANGSESSASNLKLRVRMTKNTAMKLLNQSQSSRSISSVPLKVLNNTTLSGKSLLEAVGFAASKKSKLRIRMKKDTVSGLGVKNTGRFKSSDMLGSYAKRIFGAIVKKVSQNSLDPVKVDNKMSTIQKRKATGARAHQHNMKMSSLGEADNIVHNKPATGETGISQNNAAQNNSCKKYYARRSSSTKVKEFLDNASKSLSLPKTPQAKQGTPEKFSDNGKEFTTSLPSCSASPSKKSLIKVNVPDDVLKLLQPVPDDVLKLLPPEADVFSNTTGKGVEPAPHTTSLKSRNLFDDIMSSMDMEKGNESTTSSLQTIVKNSGQTFSGNASDVQKSPKNVFDLAEFVGSKYPTPSCAKIIGDKDGETCVAVAATMSSNIVSTDKNVAQEKKVNNLTAGETSVATPETTLCLQQLGAPLSQPTEDCLDVEKLTLNVERGKNLCLDALSLKSTRNSVASHVIEKDCILNRTELISSDEDVDVVGAEDTPDSSISIVSSVAQKGYTLKTPSSSVSDSSKITLNQSKTALTQDQDSCPTTEETRVVDDTNVTSSDEDIDVVGIEDAPNSTLLKISSFPRKRGVSRRAAPSISDSSQKLSIRLNGESNGFSTTGKTLVSDSIKLSSPDDNVNENTRKEREARRLTEDRRRKHLRAKYQRLKGLVGGESKNSILLKATTECKELKEKEAELVSQIGSLKQRNVELNDRRKLILSDMLSLKQSDSDGEIQLYV